MPIPPASPARTRKTLLLALVLALGVCLCLLFWRGTAGAPATAAVPFDQNLAIRLTGEQVPPELDSFYLFVTEPGLALAEEAAALAGKLLQAAEEHDYLGIIGPDPKRNHQALIEALRLAQGQAGQRSLGGLIVIYLGPEELAKDVSARVGASGADLRYVVYPAAAGAPI